MPVFYNWLHPFKAFLPSEWIAPDMLASSSTFSSKQITSKQYMVKPISVNFFFSNPFNVDCAGFRFQGDILLKVLHNCNHIFMWCFTLRQYSQRYLNVHTCTWFTYKHYGHALYLQLLISLITLCSTCALCAWAYQWQTFQKKGNSFLGHVIWGSWNSFESIYHLLLKASTWKDQILKNQVERVYLLSVQLVDGLSLHTS